MGVYICRPLFVCLLLHPGISLDFHLCLGLRIGLLFVVNLGLAMGICLCLGLALFLPICFRLCRALGLGLGRPLDVGEGAGLRIGLVRSSLAIINKEARRN